MGSTNPTYAGDWADRLNDADRNKILNQCSADLEDIVRNHDPEVHNLNNRVWDRLDKMAVEIEVLAASR